MKKLFVIGGMGAGKSTVRKVLGAAGVPFIDLDSIGHEVLLWDTVKEEMVHTFGVGILNSFGDIDRKALAAAAFSSPAKTRKLNHISMPRIEEAYTDKLTELEAAGNRAAVIEYSVFAKREGSLAHNADMIIAVVAPLEVRVARAVASGFAEEDVRNRIERQITDDQRVAASDVVFVNDGTPEELEQKVLAWWQSYQDQIR